MSWATAQALATFGSDFNTIATLFPSRTRRAIKLKFTREEKSDPGRIDAALKGRTCNSTAYQSVLSRLEFEPNCEVHPTHATTKHTYPNFSAS